MVVCAVKLCRNYTGKNIKPPEGISFHRFPTDEEQKQQWISAIQRGHAWSPGTHCRVCSVHFDTTDFKVSETGRRILHKDAIPTKNLYREEREDTVFSFKRKTVRKHRRKPRPVDAATSEAACRACLAVRGAMFALSDKLLDTFSLLTRVAVTPTDGFPQHLCNMCLAQLYKMADFQTRCEVAQDILNEARSQQLEITPDFLRSIDRRAHNLILPLTIKQLPSIDVIELQIKEEDSFHVDTHDMTHAITDLHDSSDFDIFDRADMFDDKLADVNMTDVNMTDVNMTDVNLTDVSMTDGKFFETDVKIEHNFVLDEGQAKFYGVEPKHEIFVEVDTKKILKTEKKKKEMKKKSKKVKKEKNAPTVIKRSPKEDVRNTKPRKTDEDYDNFAKLHNVEIVFLTQEQQIAEVESRKESDNYKNSRFKCEECFKGFTGEAAFANHQAIHDPSVGNYVCAACKFRFPKRYKLLHHMTQHKMNFICRQCGHVSKLASKAMEHFKWHNGVKYPCHFCEKIFFKRTSQFNHMRNRHGSAACDICQEIFSGERGLLAHMQKTHREAVKSRCEVCNIQFHSESAYNLHIDSAPEGQCSEYIKACAECGENFPTEDALNDHMKINHWKEIKCDKCNANFENEKLYRTHRVIHKETRNRGPRDPNKWRPPNKHKKTKPTDARRSMCEMCGLTWRSKAALKYHQRVHTGEKPHPCPLCPKTFRIQDSLQIHMNTHTGARPFKCPHCPKAFKSRTQNHKHQLVHTKVRRYRCDLCDKTFQTSTCVKTHIKTVHMKIPAAPRARRRPSHVEKSPQHMYMPHDKLQLIGHREPT